MQALESVVNYILSLGNYVFVPAVLFLLAVLWFRMKFGEAFRSAVLIGVGFVGIGIIVGFLINTLSPAVKAIVDRWHLGLNVIDVGNIAAITIGSGFPTVAIYIPVGILTNLVMLALGWTKTLNIDIWNFWYLSFIGGFTYAVTGNMLLGALAIVIHHVLVLLIADWTQPITEKFFNLPGVSITTGAVTTFMITAWPFMKLFEKIPALEKIEVTPDSIKQRLGPFGEAPVMGLVMGVLFGILGGQSFQDILKLGFNLAAVFVLLMRIVAVLMEGLVPISNRAREFLTERYKGRQIYIGLDQALTIGHPAVLATSLLMMPIAFFLAAILPGNHFLPSGDLIIWPFVFAMIVGACNGNIFKSVVVSIFTLAVGYYIAPISAPAFTDAMVRAGLPAMQAGQLATCTAPGITIPVAIHTLILNLLK
jgi:PTS system galactitol-specific IIC component